MRFYLDEDLSQTIAIIARRLGVDVTSAQELGRRGIVDREQLRYATAEGRCLVTVDCRDFEQFSSEFFESGEPHAGVLCVPSSWRTNQFSRIARALARYDREHPDGMQPYRVEHLCDAVNEN